jgi:hypothetical protein
MKLGRNDACHCGSGKKYKKCHEAEDEAKEAARLAAEQAKAEAERAAAEAAAEDEDEPEATPGTKRVKSHGASTTPRPHQRIATAANPIRRGAV